MAGPKVREFAALVSALCVCVVAYCCVLFLENSEMQFIVQSSLVFVFLTMAVVGCGQMTFFVRAYFVVCIS